MENTSDIRHSRDNPFLSLLKREIENRKKSLLLKEFGNLEYKREFQFFLKKYEIERPKWILALPRHSKTIVIIHSLSGRFPLSDKFELSGKEQKIKVIPPNKFYIKECVPILKMISEIAAFAECDSGPESLIPPMLMM